MRRWESGTSWQMRQRQVVRWWSPARVKTVANDWRGEEAARVYTSCRFRVGKMLGSSPCGANGIGGRESQVTIRCLSAGSVVVGLLLAVAWPAAGQAPHASRPTDQERMTRAVREVLQKGFTAHVPPHLSVLLGISPKEEDCLVAQSVVRNENGVQTFDVSITNYHDVVVAVVNREGDEQTHYLTSPQGTLRKVVWVHKGVGSEQRITGEIRKAFEREKQFWLERLVPAAK